MISGTRAPNIVYNIIPDCRMPIIVKPTPRPDSENPFSAEARGAVYLHGCMHGEAMADLRSVSVYD